MAIEPELLTTKALCFWAALFGAGLYARRIAATQPWPASSGWSEAVVALAYLMVPVALALFISAVRIVLATLVRMSGPTAERRRAPGGSFAI